MGTEQQKMQEEQERSEYRRFLAQFTTENFLEKVPQQDPNGGEIPMWKREMMAKKAAEKDKNEDSTKTSTEKDRNANENNNIEGQENPNKPTTPQYASEKSIVDEKEWSPSSDSTNSVEDDQGNMVPWREKLKKLEEK